jgi:hypothetical protein
MSIQDETKNLRKLSEPGLKLLGFKPESKIKIHHHLRSSSFIYPEEGLIQGNLKKSVMQNFTNKRRVISQYAFHFRHFCLASFLVTFGKCCCSYMLPLCVFTLLTELTSFLDTQYEGHATGNHTTICFSPTVNETIVNTM